MPSTPALSAPSAGASFGKTTIERRAARADDVEIDIKYCGICHSDVHQARDEWGGSIFPMVPGHEIAGVVTGVGADVTRFSVGDRVGVGCMVDSCGSASTALRARSSFASRETSRLQRARVRRHTDLRRIQPADRRQGPFRGAHP